jgi:hypothetical protein
MGRSRFATTMLWYSHHFHASKGLRCYESMKWHEILVEGTDANASLGVRDRHDDNEAMGRDRVMGRYGIPHVNAAGRKMLQMLGIRKLCVPRSNFRKTPGHEHVEFSHTTWRHPARKSSFQLDYFIMGPREPRLHCIDRRVLENPGVLGETQFQIIWRYWKGL